MFLRQIILKNFRGYKNQHQIQIDQLTAFIGKNDAGKSSIFDALAAFFDHPLGKIDSSDICVHAGRNGELRIGCVFSDFPESITIDASSVTTLAGEYLLNGDDMLEIHKVYEFADGTLKKPKVFAIANHPTANGFNGLLSKKNAELKKIGEEANIDAGVDKRSNVALRKAIWGSASDLKLCPSEIQLDKEDAKAIWEQLSKYLPEYALFRADRPSTDEDSEVQDPLKVAIKQAIEEIKEIEIVGKKRQYYVLKFAIGNMVTNVPIENSEEIGIRPVIEKQEAKKALQYFRDAELEDDANWNKRQRDNLIKIKSGDIYQVILVLKELMYREKIKGLSTSERKTLTSAKQIVVSELVLSEVADVSDIESILNDTVDALV